MTNESDPREALAEIAAAREAVAQDLNYPVIWDLGYGVLLAAMIGGAALGQPWSAPILLGSLAGLFFMIQSWRKRLGWWVNGFSPPRARWVAIGLGVALAPLMGLSLWARFGDAPGWIPLLAGGLAGLAGVVGGRIWLAVYRQELKAAAR